MVKSLNGADNIPDLLSSHTASLAENANHIAGTINIKSYSNLVTNNDWTSAINQAISDSPSGGTIIFPEGSYNHSGFTINKTINIKGCGKYSTLLINTSTNDCITISSNVERGSIKDIGIFGNGTQVYGTDATSGYGIVLNNNTVVWLFENVWFRYHGKHIIYTYGLGNVNNINIINCEIEYSKQGGIYIVAKDTANQINAVIVKHCNFSGLGGNGLSVWGNNIVIDSNSIQACNGYGINISSDLTVAYSAQSIKISNNYFETCKNGLILLKAQYVSPNARYLFGVTIEDNYGSLLASQVNSGITDVVSFQNPNNGALSAQLRRIYYLNNSLTTDTLNIVNGNNILGTSSVVYIPVDASGYDSHFVNLGLALVHSLKTLVINGYFLGKGISYSSLTESDSITTAPSTGYYPVSLSKNNAFKDLNVYVDTNNTSVSISLSLYARPKGSIAAYSALWGPYTTSLTSSGLVTASLDVVKSLLNNEDCYLQITINSMSGGTYLKLGNPYITYI